jgi:hypothetical protein
MTQDGHSKAAGWTVNKQKYALHSHLTYYPAVFSYARLLDTDIGGALATDTEEAKM